MFYLPKQGAEVASCDPSRPRAWGACLCLRRHNLKYGLAPACVGTPQVREKLPEPIGPRARVRGDASTY